VRAVGFLLYAVETSALVVGLLAFAGFLKGTVKWEYAFAAVVCAMVAICVSEMFMAVVKYRLGLLRCPECGGVLKKPSSTPMDEVTYGVCEKCNRRWDTRPNPNGPLA
jgi:hypothetical protein